jgi:peptide/nickel transport system substrate-binding protein
VYPTTVNITLSAPDASFLAALAAVPCGIADSKTLIAKGATDAEDAKEKDKATPYLNNTSEGSGPYKLVSFTQNVEAVMERNPTYWGPKPYFAKVVIKHVPRGIAQREMVERGDADVAHDLDPDLAVKITPGGKIKLVEGLSMNLVYLAIQTNPDVAKELSDKKVRQAISYAIDYDGIIQGLIRGAGDRPPAMLPIGVLGVDKVMRRQQDLAKAKLLLTEAGYPNGFTVKLTYASAPLLGVAPEPLAAKLQADLALVGIMVTQAPGAGSVAISEYRTGKVQLGLFSWSPDYLDAHPFADAFYGAGPVAKRLKYKNPVAGDLIASAAKEQDPKKRDAFYKDLTKVVLEDVPQIMLIQPKAYVGINPAIKGYEIHPIWFVTVAKLSR